MQFLYCNNRPTFHGYFMEEKTSSDIPVSKDPESCYGEQEEEEANESHETQYHLRQVAQSLQHLSHMLPVLPVDTQREGV